MKGCEFAPALGRIRFLRYYVMFRRTHVPRARAEWYKRRSVEKTQIALKSGGKTSEDTEPIELDSSSLFVAHGKCLEILFHTE